ncbi:folC: bifunctional protein FolC [Rubrobacter radiotolerans]|uniref:tetrahydrofolate synthase n=1 Tax=Rubrobacter radiotolerans TaxID=42256 RepID=A0A023X2Y3_RUBRA|nr:cyanophycin synthetase [Rubrobacter radiotolerans]AHY46827.1 folC: bifunctional protein FolC [Rubrobacter radiotolerans]MDX5894233.1 cyanophycin synthetase [Rubrobacter radiotolerans]SMC05525.1 dihydrofolate synthase / folylpolyglutamate synthase [Rubrobacter radiotolerans DSM 5868]
MAKTLPSFEAVAAELDRRRFVSLGFERIRALLGALGEPQRELRVVQVVGTNGKGTTAVALSAALEALGETAGTYLSPHVTSYTERLRLRGTQATEEEFARWLGHAIEVADGIGAEVTQFELLTAGALYAFREAGVRWAVLEAGLGARFDATTAAGPEAVALTNVGLDHTEYLGETIEEISREKLASVPEGGTLFLGTDDPTVLGVARETCRERDARLVEGWRFRRVESRGLTPYARRNLAFGVGVGERLLGRELDRAGEERVVGAVRGALPGRFEVIRHQGVDVILDGGHNVEGLEATLEAVREAYPGVRPGVVFGALRDKDTVGMLLRMVETAGRVFLTTPDDARAEKAHRVLERLLESGELPEPEVRRLVSVEPEPEEALGRAVASARESDAECVLVTGSFTTVAGVRERLLRATGEGEQR